MAMEKRPREQRGGSEQGGRPSASPARATPRPIGRGDRRADGTGQGRPRRVVVADADPLAQRHLRDMLTAADYAVVGLAGDRETARRLMRQARPDVALLDVLVVGQPEADDAGTGLLTASPSTDAVVVLTAYHQREVLAWRGRGDVDASLIKPVRQATLRPTIEIALARAAEVRALRGQVRSLQEALETRALVDGAKALLMEAHGLSEAEAFRRLQKGSMDLRRPMREVAAAVIAGQEIPRASAQPARRDEACA